MPAVQDYVADIAVIWTLRQAQEAMAFVATRRLYSSPARHLPGAP